MPGEFWEGMGLVARAPGCENRLGQGGTGRTRGETEN